MPLTPGVRFGAYEVLGLTLVLELVEGETLGRKRLAGLAGSIGPGLYAEGATYMRT